MITTEVENQYFICSIQSPLEPIPLQIASNNPHINLDRVYFGKIFEVIEQRLSVRGLTFYLTWNTQQLPTYGNNVVAVILGDEFSRIPTYITKVGAVFKTLSMRPILGSNLLLQPSYLNLMALMQLLRVWVIRLPTVLTTLAQRLKGESIAPIYDVPLGYYNQDDLPIKPIAERKYDLFFAGSLIFDRYPLWSRQRWFRNPKDIARKKMLSTVTALQAEYPHLKIAIGTTDDFGKEAKTTNDLRSYSEKLMDAKICLAPRGSLFETFRFFEGLRYGCIVVTEALPPRWFYQNAPVIQLSNWSELKQKIEHLLQDRQLLESMHTESVNCWHQQCSEVAIGNYMAEKILSTIVRSC